MDPRLLDAYNEELVYLREAAKAFGAEHVGVAGRLGLNAPDQTDPHVERLLEGVAFLSARVQLKLQDQFPVFTQHLLSALQPHYVAPTPSMCVVAFEPRDGDANLIHGLTIPRGERLEAVAADEAGSLVTFTTAHPVTLLPLRIVEAEYLSSRAAVAPWAAGANAQNGLRLRFAAAPGARLADLSPEALCLYLDGTEGLPGELYRQLVGHCVGVVARPYGETPVPLVTDLPHPEQIGFEDEEALLPCDGRSFRGYRLLSEYFACPERFHFI